MSEDNHAALATFEKKLTDATGIRRAKLVKKGAVSVELAARSPEQALGFLHSHLVPIGQNLLMGSRTTLLDRLTDVKRGEEFETSQRNALALLADQDADAEGQGYLIIPSGIHAFYGTGPKNACIVLDNAISVRDPWKRRREGSAYLHDECRGYSLVSVQTGHNPILIFPHGSIYAEPEARNIFIDAWCRDDINELDNHNR